MYTPYNAPVRVNPVRVHPHERRLSMGETWRFRLDPEDRGLERKWFSDSAGFDETIKVPGCWQGQGFGHDGCDTLFDFRLSARVFRATYTGTGWYGKTFAIPDTWRGLRVWLNFGGVHPSAEVWLNGIRLGAHHAPFVPFGFEITKHVRFGEENAVAVRIHEEDRDLGFAYNWQGNWSGFYRGVELTATGPVWIEQLWFYPDADGEKLRVKGCLGGLDAAGGNVALRVVLTPHGQAAPLLAVEWPMGAENLDCELAVPAPRLWSPDTPNLYWADATLIRNGEPADALIERVGFVKLSAKGKHILINSEPYYLRGSGDHALGTWTGTPDGADRDGWRRKLRTLREYGYNFVRCPSLHPAPEYFDAADEVGLLVQSDMGMLGGWSGHSVFHVYNWPYPMPGRRERIKWQWDRAVMRDVNHPSANIYCMSNEHGGVNPFPRISWQCYHDTKRIKPTALVIWTDGGYLKEAPHDFIVDEGCEGRDYDAPLIQHEFRWWSSFPDVRIMPKYSGAIRPYAAQIALEAAKRHGIGHVLPLAAEMSQRLQFIEAKAKMEICRRDNGGHRFESTGRIKLCDRDNDDLAGISHFNAMDTNASPQGMVDEFYELKYADAETWRQTNGDTVILSSLGFDDRVLTDGDILRCGFFVSDFSHPPLNAPAIEWTLRAGPTVLAAGLIEYARKPYCTRPAGGMETAIGKVSVPVKATLEALLSEGARRIANRWDLWLMPKRTELPPSAALHGHCEHTWLKTLTCPRISTQELMTRGQGKVVLTERMDKTLVAFARGGGRIILAASEGLVRPFLPKFGFKLGRYFFTPPANYPPYEDGHDGTIIARHPMLGDLPHEGFADLQFFRMMADSPPLELEALGLNASDPVIRVMHSYPVGRSLGYLTECAFGVGGLIVCALNLDQSWVEARYLLAQICAYAADPRFAPAGSLDEDGLAAIVAGAALP